jgi:hypothetical protein
MSKKKEKTETAEQEEIAMPDIRQSADNPWACPGAECCRSIKTLYFCR